MLLLVLTNRGLNGGSCAAGAFCISTSLLISEMDRTDREWAQWEREWAAWRPRGGSLGDFILQRNPGLGAALREMSDDLQGGREHMQAKIANGHLRPLKSHKWRGTGGRGGV